MKITALYINTTKKDGTALISQYGKPFWKVSIKTDQYGDKYIYGNIYKEDELPTWKVGDEVKLEVTQNGDFLNFKVPTKNDGLEGRVQVLENQMKTMFEMMKVKMIHSEMDEQMERAVEADKTEIKLEDIPF